jgi:hypothetical protein
MRASATRRPGHFSLSALLGLIAVLTALGSLVAAAVLWRWEWLLLGGASVAFAALCVRVHLGERHGKP